MYSFHQISCLQEDSLMELYPELQIRVIRQPNPVDASSETLLMLKATGRNNF
jgi:hypothetical protein